MAIINAPVTGSVWKIEVAIGDDVAIDDELMILESMKMEIPVEAETAGVVKSILRAEGDSVSEGDPLLEIQSA
jgi:acetyl-CoA carboxylase biotin carboxyl carrier protein